MAQTPTITYRSEGGVFVRDVRLPRKNAVTRTSIVMPTDSDYATCVLSHWDGHADRERLAHNWAMRGIGRELAIVLAAGRTVPAWVLA